jgi:hypothetical protein
MAQAGGGEGSGIEKINSLHFGVCISRTADVTINVVNLNDNSPSFKQLHYTFNISEALPGGSLVGGVRATDKDGDSVSYKLDNSAQAGKKFETNLL